MFEKRISTLPRFLYLNTYAILLMFTGIGVGLIPLYRVSMWLLPAQLILFVICFRNSLKLFGSWKDKKRKYTVLMERNAREFRPESFSEYMQAPCGRLLVRVVLADLGRPGMYAELGKYRKSFAENLKSGCRPVKTVVYMNGEKL